MLNGLDKIICPQKHQYLLWVPQEALWRRFLWAPITYVFGWEVRRLNFNYTLLSADWLIINYKVLQSSNMFKLFIKHFYALTIFSEEGGISHQPCPYAPSHMKNGLLQEDLFLSYNGPWQGHLCHISSNLQIFFCVSVFQWFQFIIWRPMHWQLGWFKSRWDKIKSHKRTDLEVIKLFSCWDLTEHRNLSSS